MKIITLASQKGGTGKSTLCLCLHYSFLKYSNNMKLCIVDMDPQQSITNLVGIKKLDIDIFGEMDPEKLTPYSIVIVDTPPRLSIENSELYKQSDLILIPSKTGLFDVLSTVQTVRTVQEIAPNTPKFAILNQATATTGLNQQVKNELSKNGVEVLKTIIGNRIAYQHAMYDKGNIFTSTNQKAKQECTEMATEIYSKLI